MLAAAAVVAFAVALILHWTGGAGSVIYDCVLFGALLTAAHLAWPGGPSAGRR
jgi:hypothetical protein